MIEEELASSIDGLRNEIKEFILNNRKDSQSSASPEKAVVSIKTDRGTLYQNFLKALDETQAAYYEIYSSHAGISPEEFRQLNLSNPSDKKIYDKGKKGIPMNISIAEPTAVNKGDKPFAHLDLRKLPVFLSPLSARNPKKYILFIRNRIHIFELCFTYT